jgi:hypothetical protein
MQDNACACSGGSCGRLAGKRGHYLACRCYRGEGGAGAKVRVPGGRFKSLAMDAPNPVLCGCKYNKGSPPLRIVGSPLAAGGKGSRGARGAPYAASSHPTGARGARRVQEARGQGSVRGVTRPAAPSLIRRCPSTPRQRARGTARAGRCRATAPRRPPPARCAAARAAVGRVGVGGGGWG